MAWSPVELLGRAIEETTPSLGTASLGEMPSYGFERVANLEEVKQRLTESVIWQMKEPERFTRLGIEPPRGILLYGPPGTGKTFVIRALAHESGAAFFPIKGAELLDKYVGESERAVREVFARARAVAPSILFFDEIDALAPVRGNSTNSVTDSVVAALLTELDGVADRGDVFAIGATNRRDLVDPALLRPGRLETHLFLGLPASGVTTGVLRHLRCPARRRRRRRGAHREAPTVCRSPTSPVCSVRQRLVRCAEIRALLLSPAPTSTRRSAISGTERLRDDLRRASEEAERPPEPQGM